MTEALLESLHIPDSFKDALGTLLAQPSMLEAYFNDDSSSHTVTSGNIIEGPDKIFDSGLIKAGETFSFKFEKAGTYNYFCMIHPWANASVTVN